MARARFTGWIRSALPAAVIDAPDEVRGRRDRIVDAAMYLISFCIATATLATTWELHPPWLRVVAIVVGIGTIVSLRWRRTPSGRRRDRRRRDLDRDHHRLRRQPRRRSSTRRSARVAVTSGIVAGLAIVWSFTNPLLYPDKDYWQDVGASLLLTARRGRLGPLRARAPRRSCGRCASRPTAPGTRRARPSGGGSRARCTTCSPTASRCSRSTPARSSSTPMRRPRRSPRRPGVIRESARAALDELRGVIGVLREDGRETLTQPPQPTLADLACARRGVTRGRDADHRADRAGRRGAARRRRPHRLPDRAGGPDQRAQARAGSGRDAHRPAPGRRRCRSRSAASRRWPSPRARRCPGRAPA